MIVYQKLIMILKKKNLLNHENIIVNNKYINDKNFLVSNEEKENNNNINSNNNIPSMNKPGFPNKLNTNLSNNAYPSFNNHFSKEENNMPNISNNNIIINRIVNDKNIPNIIGEEIEQVKARYPIYQSSNLLENSYFAPSEAKNETKIDNDLKYLGTPKDN